MTKTRIYNRVRSKQIRRIGDALCLGHKDAGAETGYNQMQNSILKEHLLPNRPLLWQL